MGAVVTHKVRIINDYSFEANTDLQKGGLNTDTDSDSVPLCVCEVALPKVLAELVSLRNTYPNKRILMSKADVSDAFQNVRIDPGKAHNFCYTVGDLLVIDFRLTFEWSGSPGFGGVKAAAAEHAHCNTSFASAQVVHEGADMMAHVRIVDRWEVGEPTLVPANAKISTHAGGMLYDPFFATVYVDEYLLIRVQHSDNAKTALTASASQASDHVRLFGPGEVGEAPMLALKKSIDWDTTIDALGFTIHSHMLRISYPREKTEAIKKLLGDHWPPSRHQAKARDVLSLVGKLWNLAYVVRAGMYFVRSLLRLTGLHHERHPRNQKLVRLGRVFHTDLLFWKWAIDRKLLQEGETISAPCHTAIKRPANRHLSDASFDAVGGYCAEKNVCWRYDLLPELTAELKRKAALRQTCTITINLLELWGMVSSAWLMLELRGDRPASVGDPLLMPGDNVAAVTWVNRCGGATDKRACLLMRMLSRLEIKWRWNHVAKHIPGVQNTLADGISRWPRPDLAAKVRELTNSGDWGEQKLGSNGKNVFELVLQATDVMPRHVALLWNIMENGWATV